jgi:hypothetical protein
VTRSFRLLAVAVLTIVLALSAAQTAFASTEIKYDDGSDESYVVYGLNMVVGVRFSLPLGWASALLLSATIMIDTSNGNPSTQQAKVHVFDATGMIDLVTPFTVTLVGGWNTVSIPSVPVSGDFYVAFQNPSASALAIRTDTDHPTGRSVSGVGGLGSPSQKNWNYMIRAYVDPNTPPTGAPVGGFMEPVNKLSIIAPYLIFFGLIVAVAVVIVKPWKKPER